MLWFLALWVCSFDHRVAKMGRFWWWRVRSPQRAYTGPGLSCAFPGQGHGRLLCFGRFLSPMLEVCHLREMKRKFWIIPISLPSVSRQAQVIAMPSPGVVVGRVPLSRTQIAHVQGKNIRSSRTAARGREGGRDESLLSRGSSSQATGK